LVGLNVGQVQFGNRLLLYCILPAILWLLAVAGDQLAVPALVDFCQEQPLFRLEHHTQSLLVQEALAQVPHYQTHLTEQMVLTPLRLASLV
jgi:hypothetical protein